MEKEFRISEERMELVQKTFRFMIKNGDAVRKVCKIVSDDGKVKMFNYWHVKPYEQYYKPNPRLRL